MASQAIGIGRLALVYNLSSCRLPVDVVEYLFVALGPGCLQASRVLHNVELDHQNQVRTLKGRL